MRCRCDINLPNWLILELTGSAQLPAHRNGCSLYIALYNCFFLSVRKTNSYSNLALTVHLGAPVRQPQDLFYSSTPQFLQKAGIAWNHVISHPVGDTAVVIAVGPVRLKWIGSLCGELLWKWNFRQENEVWTQGNEILVIFGSNSWAANVVQARSR